MCMERVNGEKIMALMTILEQVKDKRRECNDCDFNGYLEDYIETIEEESTIKSCFHSILEKNADMKICVNFRFSINKEVISNQIIRYKDSFKLQGNPIVCPYILYGNENDNDRGLILVDNREEAYLYAKGVYYCLTEPMSAFVDAKNEIIAMAATDEASVMKIFDRLFTYKAGALQRELDRKAYDNYDDLKTDAMNAAQKMKDEAAERIRSAENPEDEIRNLVVSWFLLKKVVYVQYMVSKDILERVHEGNIKKQRNQAKMNSDEIPFLSYSDCWRSLQTAEEIEFENE